MSLLSGMLRSTHDHVAIKDLDGRYLFMNPAGAHWFGLPVDAIVGRTNADLFGPEAAAAIFEHDRTLLVDGQTMEYEEVQTRDGVTRTWLTTKEVIRDQAGVIIAYGAISREITERVRAEAALARADEAERRATRLLMGILDGTSDHISVRDLEGRYLLVNRAAAAWLGAPAESMLGHTYIELFGTERAATVLELDRRVISTGRPVNVEHTVTHNGVTRDWLTTRDVIRDGAGTIVAHFAISRDVTDVKRAAEQTQQSQKMESIGRLAGGIAHDFNNLLTVISGNAEYLLGNLRNDDARPAAEEIVTAANRAAAVTRQLLAFSRQQVLAPELLSVQSVVHDIEPLIRRLVGEHVSITVNVSGSPGLVRVDRSQLEQVLMNLVLNARDAMPDGGDLTVSVANAYLDRDEAATHPGTTAGPHVELAVADSGTGIDPASGDRIFEPFFTTKSVGKGTGLGLAMVDGVVRQSGGGIWVETAPGAGTTFRIRFPLVPGEVRVPGAPAPQPGRRPTDLGGSELILVVEDEAAVRAIASRILSGAGYRVLEAADPHAANHIIDEHGAELDLLLTDVMMPGGTGPDVAKRLAAVKPGAAVLYMSGYTDDAISTRGVLEPGVALITKPFSAAELLGAVRATLGRVVAPGPSART